MHPPFQIDGNFGYTAGIAEMLLQSHEGNTIRLLPALPAAWTSGFVEGLKGRGGIQVDMYWDKGTLTKAIINTEKSGGFSIVYRDKIVPIYLMKGKKFEFIPQG